jgi:AcrR family transcriptional regulator
MILHVTPPLGRLAAGSAGRRERADAILDAAAGLLSAHGYRRVSIDDVATRAEVGKGTIYLHWRSREALFWAVLQRETLQLLEQLIADLAADAELALPQRLISRIFVELDGRPLVRALLMSDKEVLGALTADESVAAAQREMTGQPDYLQLLRDQGLLRPELSVDAAGHLLNCVIQGFFAGAETAGPPPLADQAELLAFVLSRSLAAEEPPTPGQVAALGGTVIELFTAITDVQRRQLQQAY